MSDEGKVHGLVFGKAPEALIHSPTLTDGAVRTYTHMHWRYGQNKSNFEGQKSMGKFLGVSEAAISNRVNELESDNWVVTILRIRKGSTGNFTAPYYHVFESQDECIDFRDTYQPHNGDLLRPKPLKTRQRKSRKGVGGNPKWSSPKDHRPNSSLDGGANSSLDYLESSYLESSYLESVTLGDAKASSPRAPISLFSVYMLNDPSRAVAGSKLPIAIQEKEIQRQTPPIPPSSAAAPLSPSNGTPVPTTNIESKSAADLGTKSADKVSRKPKADKPPKEKKERKPFEPSVLERAAIIHLWRLNDPTMLEDKSISGVRATVNVFKSAFQKRFTQLHVAAIVRAIAGFGRDKYNPNTSYMPRQAGQVADLLPAWLEEREAAIRKWMAENLDTDTPTIPVRVDAPPSTGKSYGKPLSAASAPSPDFRPQSQPVGIKPSIIAEWQRQRNSQEKVK